MTATRHHGDHINTLADRFGFDRDGDFMGMAVVGATPTSRGAWQYHRGDWTIQRDASSQYDPNTHIWVNFPPNISPTNALLLHGNDRIRFMPHPHYFWDEGANSAPSFSAKLWDNSLGVFSDLMSQPSEAALMSVNTDPLVDTLQSLRRPVGLFSTRRLRLLPTRYGCDGLLDSAQVHDPCCVCGGGGATCEGCDSVRGSGVGYDSCGLCGGSSSCLGCDWIPFSGTEEDDCDVCLSVTTIPTTSLSLLQDSPFSSFRDCQGSCRGAALLDDCGVCSGGETLHLFNNDIDCAGVCFGNASVDTCGDCSGEGDLSPLFNRNLDCTGVCGGRFLEDSCGVCQLPAPDDGRPREHRDCSGVCFGTAELDGCGTCYGGDTGVEGPDSLLDTCGVCQGDNSTCVGCDGGVASGRSIDRCGQCRGNNCGCYLATSLSPDGGPTSGGTRITIRGAGFFYNHTLFVGLNFDPDASNCGAPRRFPNGSAVRVTCVFTGQNELLRVAAEVLSQEEVVCTSGAAVFPGNYVVEVSVQGGPFTSPLSYTYHDHALVTLREVSPVEWGLDSEPLVNFFGENFVNSTFSSCLVYDIRACYQDSPPLPISTGIGGEYVSVPASYVSQSEVRCLLPSVPLPCRVRVHLTFDGQESGRVESQLTNHIFTYRFAAPQVTHISFSDNLAGLLVEFDRPADITPSPSDLSCEDLFDEATLDLIGGGLPALCSWTNSSQEGVLVTLPPSATVRVGSLITFRNEAIRTRRTPYSFPITNLSMAVGPSSVPPVAVIDGPDSIPACGNATFSGLHSLHSGYSGFEYRWSVLTRDSTIQGFSDIIRYLDTLGTSSATISLNSDLFLEGVEYHVQLGVVNSAGVQSEIESVRLLKDARPGLSVAILGPSNRSVQFGEGLVVNSVVVEPRCEQPGGTLGFRWRLVRVLDERRGLVKEEDIEDVKAGLLQVTIPPTHFLEDTLYHLHLLVTSSGGGVSDEAGASIRVRVRPRRLRVRIHGGNRTVFVGGEVVLDARNSTYSSQLAPPTFTWICEVVGSLDACYNQSINNTSTIPLPLSLPDSTHLSFPSSTLMPGRSYQFTLQLRQGAETALGVVTLRVVDGALGGPRVEVSAPGQELLVSEEVTLSGFVFSQSPLLTVQWTLVQQEGKIE